MAIKYPITINKIQWGQEVPLFAKKTLEHKAGSFVSVRPCGEINPDNKTFLGLYIGDIHSEQYAQYSEETNTLFVGRSPLSNPAMFVFALNRVVMGYESWWGVIQSEEQLKQITDADINDIWYVKALKSLAEKADEEE